MKNRRVFLKLSGEDLAGPKKTGFDEDTVKEVARQVKASVDAGVQVGVVIGGVVVSIVTYGAQAIFSF